METIPASLSRGDGNGDVRRGKREILSRRTSSAARNDNRK